MADLNSTLDGMKKQYREIFLKTVDAIQGRIDELKPLNFKGDIFDTFEKDSIGQQWQNSVIEMFDNDISQEIFRKWTEIIDYRAKFECKGCATCCNLACAEYSLEELRNRANNGDKFAKQFTSIFIPYDSKDEAKKSILNI